jgi:methionine-rich copper-binding protein CopC
VDCGPPAPGRRISRLLAGLLTGLLTGGVGLAAAGGMVLLTAAPASAHARLKSITPVHKSVQAAAPAEVVLTFNEPVNRRYTEIKVTGPGRADVGAGEPRVERAVVRRRLGPLPAPGRYVVAYRTVSVDGHVVAGEREFTYRPAGTPAPAAPGSPGAAESGPPAGQAAGGGPARGAYDDAEAGAGERGPAGAPWGLIALGGAAVALGAGAAVAVRRGRRAG